MFLLILVMKLDESMWLSIDLMLQRFKRGVRFHHYGHWSTNQFPSYLRELKN